MKTTQDKAVARAARKHMVGSLAVDLTKAIAENPNRDPDILRNTIEQSLEKSMESMDWEWLLGLVKNEFAPDEVFNATTLAEWAAGEGLVTE